MLLLGIIMGLVGAMTMLGQQRIHIDNGNGHPNSGGAGGGCVLLLFGLVLLVVFGGMV